MKYKKIINFSILFTLITLLITPNVNAATKYAFSVGTDYGSGNGNSTPEATWVKNTLFWEGYTTSLATQPKYVDFNLQNSGRYKLESDVLYFLGHADSSKILWNYHMLGGQYAVGITKASSDSTSGIYSLTGIGKYNLTKVKLAIFQGCSTASNTSSNLPKYANAQGAKTAIGWAEDINQSDTLPWTQHFFSYGIFPNSISNQITYANSFTYSSNAIKNTRVYGNTSQSVFPSSINNPSYKSSTSNDNRRNIVNIPFTKKYDDKTELDLAKIELSKIIIDNINKEFSEKNYLIEVANNDFGKIYDLYFMIDNVKTNIGYTIFVNKDNVVTDIYDNMNGYKESELLKNNNISNVLKENSVSNLKKQNIDSFIHNNLNKEQEYKEVNSFYYYDVMNKKLSFITLIKVIDPIGTSMIVDQKIDL